MRARRDDASGTLLRATPAALVGGGLQLVATGRLAGGEGARLWARGWSSCPARPCPDALESCARISWTRAPGGARGAEPVPARDPQRARARAARLTPPRKSAFLGENYVSADEYAATRPFAESRGTSRSRAAIKRTSGIAPPGASACRDRREDARAVVDADAEAGAGAAAADAPPLVGGHMRPRCLGGPPQNGTRSALAAARPLAPHAVRTAAARDADAVDVIEARCAAARVCLCTARAASARTAPTAAANAAMHVWRPPRCRPRAHARVPRRWRIGRRRCAARPRCSPARARWRRAAAARGADPRAAPSTRRAAAWSTRRASPRGSARRAASSRCDRSLDLLRHAGQHARRRRGAKLVPAAASDCVRARRAAHRAPPARARAALKARAAPPASAAGLKCRRRRCRASAPGSPLLRVDWERHRRGAAAASWRGAAAESVYGATPACIRERLGFSALERRCSAVVWQRSLNGRAASTKAAPNTRPRSRTRRARASRRCRRL